MLEPHIGNLVATDPKTNHIKLKDRTDAYFEPFLFERKDSIKSKLYEIGIAKNCLIGN